MYYLRGAGIKDSPSRLVERVTHDARVSIARAGLPPGWTFWQMVDSDPSVRQKFRPDARFAILSAVPGILATVLGCRHALRSNLQVRGFFSVQGLKVGPIFPSHGGFRYAPGRFKGPSGYAPPCVASLLTSSPNSELFYPTNPKPQSPVPTVRGGQRYTWLVGVPSWERSNLSHRRMNAPKPSTPGGVKILIKSKKPH